MKLSVEWFLKYLGQYSVLVLLPISFLVFGCDEVRKSDFPVTRAQAIDGLGIRVSLPENAKNVRYSLSGKTQDWRLYLSYEAPLGEIEATARMVLGEYSRRNEASGTWPREDYFSKKIGSENLSSEIIRKAPDWWTPAQIENGYFIGSSHPHGYGPRLWVDKDHSKVYFFERF